MPETITRLPSQYDPKVPPIGIHLVHQGVTYETTSKTPVDGDMVAGLGFTAKWAVYIFSSTPRAMPYWSNAAACRVLKKVEHEPTSRT